MFCLIFLQLRLTCLGLQRDLDAKNEDLSAKDQAVIELSQALDRAMGGLLTEFLQDTTTDPAEEETLKELDH